MPKYMFDQFLVVRFLAVALVLSGCAFRPSEPQVSAPAVSTAEARLPAVPNWPEPGLRLLDGVTDWSPGYAYSTLTMDGMQIQPVATPDAVQYLTRKDDAIYLVGSTTDRGGFYALKTPRLLYRLPLGVGDQWSFSGGYSYHVAALELQNTPGGEKLTARIEVTGEKGQVVRREWWAPGYGLVRLEEEGKKQPWVPIKEVRETPRRAPQVGRPAPGLTALLSDDGKAWSVVVAESHKELFHVNDNYWRSWYSWRSVGEFDLLAHANFPGSWGIFEYDAWLYDQKAGQFGMIPWVDSSGARRVIAGNGQWQQDGSFSLKVHMSYPVRFYTFRFDGKVMRSDKASEQVEYAASAKELLTRMVDTPPLSKADHLSMFEKPADGEKLYAILRQDLYAMVTVEPDPAVPDGFVLKRFQGPTLAKVQVAQRGGQYKVISLTPPPATDPGK